MVYTNGNTSTNTGTLFIDCRLSWCITSKFYNPPAQKKDTKHKKGGSGKKKDGGDKTQAAV